MFEDAGDLREARRVGMKDISLDRMRNVWGWRESGNERHLARQNEKRPGMEGIWEREGEWE